MNDLPQELVGFARARGLVSTPALLDAARLAPPGWFAGASQDGRAAERSLRAWAQRAHAAGGHDDGVDGVTPDIPVRPVTGVLDPATASSTRSAAGRARSGGPSVAGAVRRLTRGRGLPTSSRLEPYMTAVMDQGELGSCTGFASAGCRSFLARVETSPLWAYLAAKSMDGMPAGVEGSFLWAAMAGQQEIGALLEGEFPYTDSPETTALDRRLLRRARKLRSNGTIDVRLRADEMDLQPQLMKAILSGRVRSDLGPRPIGISIAVYESFRWPSTGLYGTVPVPGDGEDLLGGHSMAVTGYIDADDVDGLPVDVFVVKNSWSERWAPRNPLELPGYAIVPADFFRSAGRLWEAQILVAEPSPVAPTSLLDLLRAGWESGLAVPAAVAG